MPACETLDGLAGFIVFTLLEPACRIFQAMPHFVEFGLERGRVIGQLAFDNGGGQGVDEGTEALGGGLRHRTAGFMPVKPAQRAFVDAADGATAEDRKSTR